jgi:hypothetical protein
MARPSKAKLARDADRALERLGYRRVEPDPAEQSKGRRDEPSSKAAQLPRNKSEKET